MENRITASLKLSYRENWAIKKILENLRSISIVGRFAGFLAILELFGMLFFDLPTTPAGEKLDLTGYELVFSDDFNEDTLDLDNWYYRLNGVRRGGFMTPGQTCLRDGNCVITAEYLENGDFGPGWYAGMIALKEKYLRGYFEVSCICNDSPDFWSAFWMQADAPYTPEISRGGIGGAELDIFESLSYGKPFAHNSVQNTVHCAGMEGDTSGEINSCVLGSFKGKNIYKEYNTYGLKWTESEYIFYINGVETARTSFADGVSEVPETVILSLCVPNSFTMQPGEKAEFIIDYINIWQN